MKEKLKAAYGAYQHIRQQFHVCLPVSILNIKSKCRMQ